MKIFTRFALALSVLFVTNCVAERTPRSALGRSVKMTILVDKVMQRAKPCAANVHAWAFADRFESLKDLNRL